MTVIELPDEQAAALKARAAGEGLTLEEWARRFRAWADSHDPNIPVLSEEAMSRESIYSDTE